MQEPDVRPPPGALPPARFTLPPHLALGTGEEGLRLCWQGFKDWLAQPRSGPAPDCILDASSVVSFDARAAHLLLSMQQLARQRGSGVTLILPQEPARSVLEAAASAQTHTTTLRPLPPWLAQVADATFTLWQPLRLWGGLWVALLLALLDWRRNRFLGSRLLAELHRLGAGSLGVILPIGALMGISIALQSAVQLRALGGTVYTIDLLAISLVREIGPLISAFMVAGRCGAAITSELATMAVAEEIAALEVIGIPKHGYLALPKLLALLIAQPVLTVFCTSISVLAGIFACWTLLDIGSGEILVHLQHAIVARDIYISLFKSIMFGGLIASIATCCGIHAQGGAAEVGTQTTASVVLCVFGIVVCDALFSLLTWLPN